MSFLTLIFKNLFRNKIRTLLTILGITIGIITIFTLSSITEGLKKGYTELLKAGKADFMIGQAGIADLMFSTISEDKAEEIRNIEGVDNAVGVIMTAVPIENMPFFVVMGIEKEVVDETEISGIEIIEGQSFAKEAENEILLGKISAKNLDKHIGDKITLAGKEFKVTGISETGSVWQDGGAFLSLKTLQAMQKKEGKITMIMVKKDVDADIHELTQRIEDTYPDELVTIKSIDEISKVDKGMQAIDATTWTISLLAIVIGGIGVANTMIMSVYERTREIGVLRAVGWKRRRIISLILGESFFIGILAAAVGALLGTGVIKLIMLVPQVSAFLEPSYSINIFTRALGVALLVGLFGGLYPAYRASRLSPLEALRYE